MLIAVGTRNPEPTRFMSCVRFPEFVKVGSQEVSKVRKLSTSLARPRVYQQIDMA